MLDRKLYHAEVTNGGKLKAPYFRVLVFALCYLAPIAIGLVFLDQIGVFDTIMALF